MNLTAYNQKTMGKTHQPVTCAACGIMFVPGGRVPRCPACRQVWEDVEPLPPLPKAALARRRLEDPAFPRSKAADDRAAPLGEFLAAGFVLVGFLMMVGGVATALPPLLIAGLAALGLAVVVYAVSRLRAMITGRSKDKPYHENPWNLFGPFL